MKKYIIKRILQLLPILLGITFLSFAMMRLAGSDAVTEMYSNTGSAVSEEVLDAAREELGLNRPFLVQYFSWLGEMMRGNMGVSYISGRDVFATFVSKLPATLLLTVLSVLLTIVISVPLGILAAVKQGRLADQVLRFLSFAELLRGAAADAAAVHETWMASRDLGRYNDSQRDYADVDAGDCYVREVYASGSDRCAGGAE